MSGVKISEAELERRRQAELERQRLERLRKIREATDQYNLLIGQYEAFRTNVSLAMKKELQTFGSVGELRLACDSFASVKTTLDSEVAQRLSLPLPIEPEDIQALNSKLRESLSSLENIYNKGLSEFAARLSLYNEGQSEMARSNEFAAALSKIEKAKRLEYSDISFDLSSLLNSEAEFDLSVLYDEVLADCTILINNSAIGRTERSQLLGVINDMQNNQEVKAVCDAAIYQYKALRGNVKKKIRIFNDLYNQYCALYTEWRGLCNGRKTPIDPMTPRGGFESVEILQSEIQLLDEKIKVETKRSYIREQIDEVMQIYGYSIAESIVMRGATKGQSYLFESGNRAIHLFVSDTNKIMFEPVGLNSLDGEGHTGYDGMVESDISDEDRTAIYKDQIDFCLLHPKMVEELKKRGVILGNTQVKEANLKTAKMLRVKGKQSRRRQDKTHEAHRYEEQKLREIKID